MGSKKEMKKLLERIEAIEAEIKAFKETAEKNVATISGELLSRSITGMMKLS